MSTEIIQVRDVPSADIDVVRARAASRGMSLSSYLRELIHDDTTRPTMGEVLSRIATRTSVNSSDDDLVGYVADGRP